MTYDNDLILQYLITWINDITLGEMGKRFVYAGDDIDTNLQENSKSFMIGQYYYNRDTNILYLSLTLDPNTNWGYHFDGRDVFVKMVEYLQNVPKKGLLEDLKIEMILPFNSIVEKHEAKSKCKTEEVNNYIFEDMMYLWERPDESIMFIRDSITHINNKTKMVYNLGAAETQRLLDEYRANLKTLNSTFTPGENMRTVFSTYIGYYEALHSADSTVQAPRILDNSELTRFYLLNWTDYSIKE